MGSRNFARLVGIALLAEVGFATLNLSTIALHLVSDRGYKPGSAGLVMTVFLLSEVLFKALAGKLGDRSGVTKWIRLAPWLVMVSALVTALLPQNAPGEFAIILGLRVLDGLAAALLWPNLFAYGGRVADEGSRQRAMSSLNACYILGVAIAFPMGGVADDLLGPWLKNYTGAYSGGLFLAAVAFALVGLATFNLREPASELPIESEVLPDVRGALRRIPGYLALGFLAFLAIGFPLTIIKPFALTQFGLTSGQFGFLVCPAALALAALAPTMAKRGEAMGTVRAVHLGLGLCVGGAVLVALGQWLDPFRTPLTLAVGALPLGLGFLLTLPAWLTKVQEVEPGRRASNLGAVMTAQGLGAIVAAPTGAKMYEVSGPYSPFVGTAVALMAAWSLSWRLMR